MIQPQNYPVAITGKRIQFPAMDWNSRYENKDTPWNKGMHTPVLEEFQIRHTEKLSGKIAVPGCGAGHDARWLADLEGADVHGLDIAPLAIDEARSLDPQGKVNYQVMDFLNPKKEDAGSYDLIWEHTCFCALHPSMRSAYLHSVSTLLKSGGLVAGVFFIDPEMDEGEEGPPFKVGTAELDEMWQASGFEILDAWIPTRGYEGRIGRERAMILRKRANLT